MAYYAVHAVTLGAGKKREKIPPGGCLDGKGIKTEELEALVEQGVAEVFEVTPPAKKAKPELKQVETETKGAE